MLVIANEHDAVARHRDTHGVIRDVPVVCPCRLVPASIIRERDAGVGEPRIGGEEQARMQ